MNIQQWRFIDATIRHGFNLTLAAKALYTSQPGLSRGIAELEEELGVKIFTRHGKRIRGLTAAGEAVAMSVSKLLLEINNMRKIGAEFQGENAGQLIIATTHTQARYALPSVMRAFMQKYPMVKLTIHQGNPKQIADFLLRGEADMAIATEGLYQHEGLVALPAYDWSHVLVVPTKHPLSVKYGHPKDNKVKKIKLEEIVSYPIITFDRAFAGRSKIDKVLEHSGVSANIVIEAMDADVIKTYVEQGMGIGILPSVAVDESKDKKLVIIPVGHLFGINTTWLAILPNAFIRGFQYDFMHLFSDRLSKTEIEKWLKLP